MSQHLVPAAVREAAVRYEEATLAIEGLSTLRDEAKAVLLEHFEASGAGSVDDRVGWRWTGGGEILDQRRVRELLGERTPTKRAARSRSLTLLRRGA